MTQGTITSRPAVTHRLNIHEEWCLVHTVERVVALTAAIVTAPAFVMLAIVTAIQSRRSPFVRHIRVGWRGRTLAMWKLRTMWGSDDPATGVGRLCLVETVSGEVPDAKSGADPRVSSSFASFCRRYSLDELPQFLHIVRGEMSLVGPRPITRQELEKHYADCRVEVLSVRPGLLGLWQVMGRNRLTYAQRRRLDLFLVRRGGFGLYVKILFRAIPVTLSAQGAY